MSKDKLTKKDLQTDQLEEAIVEARDYVVGHRSETAKWAALAVGAILLVGGVWGGITWSRNRAGARLSRALGILDAPLVTDGASVQPGQTIFKSEAERTAAARKELEAIAKDGSGSTAAAARLTLLGLGSGAPSPETLEAARKLASSDRDGLVGGVAAYSLLEAQASSGKTKEAIALAKEYLESSSAPLPKDILVFLLGQLHEKSGQLAEAKSYYQRVVSDFPDSPVRSDAAGRAAKL